MDIPSIRAFFMWCTIIDVGFLILTILICAGAGDWIYRMHSRWFPLSKEAFNTVIYSWIGLLKIFIIIFNLVPYLALVIIA